MNDDAGGKSALSEGLGPLPEYAQEFLPRWFGDEGGFSGAQMRLYALAAVAAERERCAKVCEAEHVGSNLTAGYLVPEDFAYNLALQHAAAAIRGA